MDAHDELRAALQSRRDQEGSAARAQEQLDREREEYEQAEEAVRERLHKVADATLQALVDSETAESISIGPRVLFAPRRRLQGWKVSFGTLCTDGTIVHRPPFANATPRPDSSLAEWVDKEVGSIRTESRENGARNIFAEAFRVDEPSRESSPQSELRSRLTDMQASITQTLADILHERGISI
jgi:hypothetical protein